AATTPNGDVFRWNGWVTGVPGSGRPGDRVSLSPAVPNPTRSSVALSFRLPRAGRAVLTVVDPQGRRVRGLLDARLEAGAHAVTWDGRDDAGAETAAGLFFLRVDFGGRSFAQKLAMLR
ncbi:MAG: hypothetical protein HZC42_02430, partial [Candidatus Eisenbacteria bacterium]|nr:hypothetical protein [Candidatus Eisenbacteria bacterium]